MRGSVRCFGVIALVAAGCGDDPAPLTGQASWADSCPPGANCLPRTHSVRGSLGSPTVDVDCQLAQVTGGYSVFFRIGAVSMGGTIDDSQEGLLATGFLPGIGQELRTAPNMNGYVSVKGLGWSVAMATVGPTGQCHVFIDRIASGGYVGRISCPAVMDDQTPPTTRIIRAGVSSAVPPTPEFGEFVFTNCATGG